MIPFQGVSPIVSDNVCIVQNSSDNYLLEDGTGSSFVGKLYTNRSELGLGRKNSRPVSLVNQNLTLLGESKTVRVTHWQEREV